MGAQKRPWLYHRLGRASWRLCSSPFQSSLTWGSVLSPPPIGASGSSCVTWSDWSEEVHLFTGLCAEPQGAELDHLCSGLSFLHEGEGASGEEGCGLGSDISPEHPSICTPELWGISVTPFR